MYKKANSKVGVEVDAATALASLLDINSWIPLNRPEWHAVVKGIFEAFLRHFEPEDLERLLRNQRRLPASAPPAVRAVRLASELTALHKVCQMLARNPALPAEARLALAPLEKLPAATIPEAAFLAAVTLARRARPALRPDATEPKIGRGSVADVFRFRRADCGGTIAFKTVRPDALVRVRRETAILGEMADEAAMIGEVFGPNFGRTLVDVLRDAARALLREIDFAGEAANLRDARELYKYNSRVRIPAVEGPALDEGIFMEFVEGTPLLETPLDAAARRKTARVLFRGLFLEPLFSGADESIFHADPHAGNILAQRESDGEVTLVLLDWSQAGRLPAPLRHAIVEFCLYSIAGNDPPAAVLKRIVEDDGEIGGVSCSGTGDPLHRAFRAVEELAIGGHRLPLDLLLLRKSFLTLDGIARQLDPSFAAWRETLIYAGWVFASEAPIRAWSLPFPWWDQPEFYRSGLPTRSLAEPLMQMCLKFASETVRGSSA